MTSPTTGPPLPSGAETGTRPDDGRGPAGDDDIAAFDRPMRDAPSPRRWTPIVIIGLGACGVAWGASMVLAGPATAPRLAAPVEEIEYTTGVVDALPPPRPAKAPLSTQDAAPIRAAAAETRDEEALREAAQKLADARRHAPVLLIGGDRPGRGSEGSAVSSNIAATETTADDLDRPLGRRSSDNVVRATRATTRPDVTLLEGAFIPATLETAIQSDLPGSIRAVVARDVYAADATRLLIPRGSRLVGAYRSGLVRGQSRVFAVWTRLIRPDGVSIALDSPVTDGAGRSGATGRRDGHFFERFGSAVLLSLIDGAIVAAGNNAGSREDTRIVLQSGGDFSRAAEIALRSSIDIPPTVNVSPGTRLQVFVNKDIDFSGVVAQSLLATDISP
ncbi:MAG: TrbI/VirB10 family protein [Hyphomonadaceae bacterium]|nr:TrbI/VirB10 family protein [Hyphomonadaceae bacterium]